MTTIPWFKFYTTDWRSDPCLGMCGLAAQGLWMKMLCLMHEAQPRGYLVVAGEQPNLEQLARLVGAPAPFVSDCMNELERNKVFSRDRHGTIYSRKMLREGRVAESARRNGAEGGNPEMRRGTASKAERTRPFKRSENPAKAQRVFDRDGGRCHWCGAPLIYSGPPAPNLYQPDYIIPLADGGTSAEENLVAACSECKRKRALRGWPFDLKLRNPDPSLRSGDPVGCRSVDGVGNGVGSGRSDYADAPNPTNEQEKSPDTNRRPQPTPKRDPKPQNQNQSQNQKAAASSTESDAASPAAVADAGPATWVILSFDEERVAVYGTAHARPFRYSVDAALAVEFAAKGLSPEQVRVTFRAAFQRRKATGQPPPSHLGYMRGPIEDAAYAAKHAPPPYNPKRPYLKPGDFDPDEERKREECEAINRRADAAIAEKRRAS